jgi:hypothetical protein
MPRRHSTQAHCDHNYYHIQGVIRYLDEPVFCMYYDAWVESGRAPTTCTVAYTHERCHEYHLPRSRVIPPWPPLIECLPLMATVNYSEFSAYASPS